MMRNGLETKSDVGLMIGALIERAEELERFIDGCQRKTASLETDIAQMRAVLAFHEQHIDDDEFLPHMSVRKLFNQKSEIFRYCRDALKGAGGCLDTRELARHAIARKGLDADDPVLRKKIVFSVQAVMKTARRKGLVTDMGRRKGVVRCFLPSRALIVIASRRRSNPAAAGLAR